jgi:hypothetical protein
MDLTIYILADAADPARARVASLVDRSVIPLPRFTGGVTLNLTIYLVTATGGYHAASGDADLTPWLALGIPGFEAVVEAADWAEIANGWTCTLDLADAGLSLLLASSPVPGAACLQFGTTEGQSLTLWAALPAIFNRQISAIA